MSILGFSHIVSEVRDLSYAKVFYEEMGFEVKYVMNQDVPYVKKKVLYGEPANVQLYYLRNRNNLGIGIELIQHDQNRAAGHGKTICYGFQQEGDGEEKVIVDPAGNKIVLIHDTAMDCHQHLFMPTNYFDEAVKFYTEHFHLKEIEAPEKFLSIYERLYFDVGRTTALRLANCLFPSWDVVLHMVETTEINNNIYLNQFGFSCFCFLLDHNEYMRLQKSSLDIIGPFEGEKENGEEKSKFDIAFIKDPTGYLVEFYMQSADRLIPEEDQEKKMEEVLHNE